MSKIRSQGKNPIISRESYISALLKEIQTNEQVILSHQETIIDQEAFIKDLTQ